jgi:hypothetical protein
MLMENKTGDCMAKRFLGVSKSFSALLSAGGPVSMAGED